MKILVIDDCDVLLQTLIQLLRSNGHGAWGANNMAAAVTLLTTGHCFDAILLDLQGGDIDRVRIAEVARQIGVRVVTMSGAYELRPNLEKPFTSAQLEAELARC